MVYRRLVLTPWPDLLRRWRARRRISRARGLVESARGIIAYGAADTSAARALRLYRKALRVLGPRIIGTSPSVAAGVDPAGDSRGIVALRREVDRQLRQGSLWAWLRRNRSIIRRYALPLLAGLALLIGGVPPLRHWVFPLDRAAGKPWTASSALPGFPGSGSVSNDGDDPVLFHTVSEPSPSVLIDLGAIFPIRTVRVANRRDCCRERALPLAIEVGTQRDSLKRVAYRRADFETWTASFPPTRAQYVRLRIDRTSMLHLRMIWVY